MKTPPHSPDPKSSQYAPLILAATEIAKNHHGRHGHRLVIFTAADFDFREVALNWYRAIKKVGLHGLVYALDVEVHVYLSGRGVPSVDGSTNLQAWNQTRISRHIQRAEAERHLAAAAIVAAGFDVLLTDASHVVLGDIAPALHAIAKENIVDMAVARSNCDARIPFGCGHWWNLQFLRGAGMPAQQKKVVDFQVSNAPSPPFTQFDPPVDPLQKSVG